LKRGKYEYCNTNFCVLELIVERITGHSLAAELAQRIFGPVGMTSSTYPDEEDLTLPEHYIRGYERTRDGWEECSHVFFAKGDMISLLRLLPIVVELMAAGAITSAEDYMSFKKLTGICCGSPLGR